MSKLTIHNLKRLVEMREVSGAKVQEVFADKVREVLDGHIANLDEHPYLMDAMVREIVRRMDETQRTYQLDDTLLGWITRWASNEGPTDPEREVIAFAHPKDDEFAWRYGDGTEERGFALCGGLIRFHYDGHWSSHT